MAFQPIIVGTGLVAWRNLQRSLPQQLELFANSAEQKRLVDRFETNASSLTSADAVVSDRQILTVALGAYGLQDDIKNRYFVKRILDEGTSSPEALANRMSDSRYQRLAADFALDGLSRAVGVLPSKAQSITESYVEQAFSVAVGDRNESLRLALNANSEMSRIASRAVSDDAKWFLVMGNPPLRSVVEKALGLPTSFGQLDIDQQLSVFRAKSATAFGTSEIEGLAESETKAKLIDRFLLKEQLTQINSYSSQSIALQLLGAGS